MDSEHWKRVERIYHRVLAYPLGRRAGVLDEFCRDDLDLRREVESLLGAREEAGSFLSSGELVAHIADLDTEERALSTRSAIGPYELLSLLGAGSMGEVYRARDTRLDRQVALKLLPADLTNDAGRVARFRQEARAASALNHPSILTIHEIGQEDGTWYIAAELIEGVTLRERMTAGNLSLDEAIQLAIQCAAALDSAHRAGIVHRDIKPENLMLRPDGVLKVVDFGLARINPTGHGSVAQVSQSGGIMGTPRYMSPEQARGEKLDARSDVFSLGAVLYEMATRRPAFPGDSTAEVFASLLNRDPGPSGCGLDSILNKALQKHPAQRYQTMEEFANDLRRAAPRLATPNSRAFQRGLRRPSLVLLTVAGALAVAAALALSLWPPAGAGGGPDAPMTFVPLTSFNGSKDWPVFSPDGTQIAFSWNGGREGVVERHIYRKALAAGDPVPLTSAAEDDILPAWSLDGRKIAFLRRMPNSQFDSYIVPSTGGQERYIAAANLGVSWSPDGKWLALANPPPPSGSGGLFLLSLETGERRELTFPGGLTDAYPAYSPDGQWIAFLRKRTERDVFIVPARGGAVRQLSFDARPKNGTLTWTANSREVIYSTQREYGGEGLWRVLIDGGSPRRLSGALQFAGSPNISRKGDRLAYTESWVDTNIYLWSGPGFSASGVPGPFGEPKKVIASSREDHSPSFSPDGEHIVFVSNRSGHSEIWTARRDGSDSKQLTHFEGFTGTPRWSPDGQWIVFDRINGNSDIWIIPAAGGDSRQITTYQGSDTVPSWSPDGAWIYFMSERSGSSQVWKIKPDGSDARQLTWNAAREARPSADGQTVYYTKRPGGAALWQVPAAGGAERPVGGMEAFDHIYRAWGTLDKGIYFVSEELGAKRDMIRFFSFSLHREIPMNVWLGRARWSGPAIALSPDGKYLLTVNTDQQSNDLMMIENFR